MKVALKMILYCRSNNKVQHEKVKVSEAVENHSNDMGGYYKALLKAAKFEDLG